MALSQLAGNPFFHLIHFFTGPFTVLLLMRCAGLAGFWKTISQGGTVQTSVPLQRWDVDAAFDPDVTPGKSYARFAAFTEVQPFRLVKLREREREREREHPH